MAIRYQIDELLQLRESPLVTKPDNLPAIEEWMSPVLREPTLREKHYNSREQGQDSPNSKRQNFFEPRHISRGSNSEDLILGPPKTAFASASRSFKSIDATDRSSSKTGDQDDPKNDRYNFKEKFFKDRDFGDKDTVRRDTRGTLANGRRIARDDKEDWMGARPRRTFGEDDPDRRIKRNGDSDRWGSRDLRDRSHQDGRDKDQTRFPPRRDGTGRGKHDSPWFRDGDGNEAGDGEEQRPPLKNREWRRGGADRDWNRHKHDAEPEWMDSTDRDGTKEVHTQEDFQRWKERMKAGTAQQQQQPQEEKKEDIHEQGKPETKPTETKRVDGGLFSSMDPALQMDAGLDKFFGLWGENKKTAPEGDGSAKKDAAPVRPAKASRFASIFSSPSETVPSREPEPQQQQQPSALTEPAIPPQPQPQPQPRPASTDADQEGFQRILQMLGGNKSRNTTPKAEDSMQQRPPQPQATQADFARAQAPMASPSREPSFNRQEYAPPFPTNSPQQERAPPGLESLLAQKPQRESPAASRDTDFLLRLMQQSKISPQPQGNLPSSQSLMSMAEMQNRAQSAQKQRQPPAFFDDPALAAMPRPEHHDPREQLRRRPTNGPPMGYFDEAGFPGGPQQGNQPLNNPNMRPQPHGQPPVGLQRPPGLEQVPTPGWSNQQMQQPQGAPNHVMLPPGLPTPNRGMNPNFPGGGPMPMHGGMPPPPPTDRQAFPQQRNVMGGGGGGPGPAFGPPPGMMPPPGYVNMNGPPPSGLQQMPHNPESMMNMQQQGNHFGGGGPPPQQNSRAILDLLAGRGPPPPGHDGMGGGRNAGEMMGPGLYR